MSTDTASAAARALDAVVAMLEDAGIEATRDAGAVYPQPTAVLVGLPELVRRTQSARVFTVPVHVISGDPLTSKLAVDRVYALADDVALVLATDTYRPAEWAPRSDAQPLPAVELPVTITVSEGS